MFRDKARKRKRVEGTEGGTKGGRGQEKEKDTYIASEVADGTKDDHAHADPPAPLLNVRNRRRSWVSRLQLSRFCQTDNLSQNAFIFLHEAVLLNIHSKV